MRACSAPRADQEADNGKGPNGVDTCPVSHPCDWRSRTAGDSPFSITPISPKFEIGGNAEAAGK
jgi:hypothetical protein